MKNNKRGNVFLDLACVYIVLQFIKLFVDMQINSEYK